MFTRNCLLLTGTVLFFVIGMNICVEEMPIIIPFPSFFVIAIGGFCKFSKTFSSDLKEVFFGPFKITSDFSFGINRFDSYANTYFKPSAYSFLAGTQIIFFRPLYSFSLDAKRIPSIIFHIQHFGEIVCIFTVWIVLYGNPVVTIKQPRFYIILNCFFSLSLNCHVNPFHPAHNNKD